MKEFRSARPFPWWVWPAYAFGATATFFIAAVSFRWALGYIVVWFSGMIALAAREHRYQAEVREQRALGPIRAEVVSTPRLDKAGARELVAGVRRELPAGRR